MSWSVQDNVRREEIVEKKKHLKLREKIEVISPVVVEKTEQSVNFLFMWTAIGWYYFFSGLAMLIRGKLPKGWKPLTEKQVVNVMSNVAESTQNRKDMRRYGKVVTIDEEIPNINLMQ